MEIEVTKNENRENCFAEGDRVYDVTRAGWATN